MPRVVCPLCRTGFEANVTRENCAVNCVSCGAAFNALPFISKTGTLVPPRTLPQPVVKLPAESSFPEPASHSTRTGGLPFMHESSSGVRAVPVSAGSLNGSQHKKEDVQDLCVRLDDIRARRIPAPAELSDSRIDPIPAPVRPAPIVPPPAPKSFATITNKPKNTTRRPLLEGRFGPFDIEGEIARGGVGAVFRARERDTGRTVALKVLLEGAESGDEDRERFQHECETAKALSLPGMVQVYSVGEFDGRPYMSMELVNGRSLDKVIPDKSLNVNECLVMMKAVAETIGALHEAGYVHRDLKPGNILLDEFNTPKVADFGLVKSLDEITRLTASGLVCGTPAYMAPEQARGDSKAVDPRSDVWALGAVLYEMLCGKPPFQAENALRLMLKITKDQPPVLRRLNMKVPQEVQDVVMKCLEKRAEDRYPNARAMAQDIARFLNGEPLEARSQTGERVQRFIASTLRNQRALVTFAGGVAALVLVAVLARVVFAKSEAGPMVERGYKVLGDARLKLPEQLDNAERCFRDAIGLDPKNARAHLGLGLCVGRRAIDKDNHRAVDARKVDEAVKYTRLAGELDSKLKPEAMAQCARLKMWMGEHVDEAHYLEQAVQLVPSNLKYREALGMAYWNSGAQSRLPGYYKRAVSEFQYILSVSPTYPRVSEYIRSLQQQFLAQVEPAASPAAPLTQQPAAQTTATRNGRRP